MSIWAVFERDGRRFEVRAGVDHFGIEPQFVEVGAEIVVAVNVFARAVQGVGLGPLQQFRTQAREPGARISAGEGAENCGEYFDQVAFDFYAAFGVGVAEFDFGAEDDSQERLAVADEQRACGCGVAWRDFAAARKDNANRGLSDNAAKFLEQEILEG